MRNKELRLKYKAMQHLISDMEYLVDLGFAECLEDPKTGELGYRIKENGIQALVEYQNSNVEKEYGKRK